MNTPILPPGHRRSTSGRLIRDSAIFPPRVRSTVPKREVNLLQQPKLRDCVVKTPINILDSRDSYRASVLIIERGVLRSQPCKHCRDHGSTTFEDQSCYVNQLEPDARCANCHRMDRPCYADGEVRRPNKRRVRHPATGELTLTPWIPADQRQGQQSTAHQQSNLQKEAQQQTKSSNQNSTSAISDKHSSAQYSNGTVPTNQYHSASSSTPVHPAASYSDPTNHPTPYSGPTYLNPPLPVPYPSTAPYSAYEYPDPEIALPQYPVLPYLSTSYSTFQTTGFQIPGTPVTASPNVSDQASASDTNGQASNENQAVPISRIDPMLFRTAMHAANHNSTSMQTSNGATPDNEDVDSSVFSMHGTGSSRTAPPINPSKQKQKPKVIQTRDSATVRMNRKRDDIDDDETEEPGTLVGRNLRPLAKKPFKPEFKPKPKPTPKSNE